MSRRIVIITEIIAPYRIPVFNALARHDGVELHVIFLAESDPTEREWLVYKDEICFSYQVLPSWRRRVGRHNLLLNWGAEAALGRARPDLVVCGGYNYVAAWQSMAWARRNRVPFALWAESTTRDLRSGHALIELLKAKFLRRCDAFVVPGKSSIEYLRNYGVPEDTIFTAPNAVDTEFFAERADMIRRDPAMHREALHLPARFFLFAGRLVPEKGIFDLVRAYSTLTPELREKIGLVFVGDGVARTALQQCAATIRPGSIHFAGFAQRERLPTYYALAEALIFPTHTDPWGLVVNEAMACGLPVMCSDAAGCVADLVENGSNGRVFPTGDVSQLASAMDELARDAELRSLMGQRSKERIAQYSPAAWAAGMASAVLPYRRRAA
ncbi:MAG TPA: glycosyltransferase family 4 protein [Terriglobales bacterium]|nr:glycosyltransferase family 4 protein [Terriglobales bacterium]